MQNFSSLASKLREEFEVTNTWIDNIFSPLQPYVGGYEEFTITIFLNSPLVWLLRDNC